MCMTLFCTFLCLHCTATKWNDQILILLGTGNSKAINSTISVRNGARSPLFSSSQNSLLLSNRANSDNRENVWKDAKSIFERSFHGRCSLSDRKVANFVISRRMQFWDSYEIYRKAWCTFRVVVFRIKPIAFFMFPLRSPSFIRSLLKVRRRRRQRERQKKSNRFLISKTTTLQRTTHFFVHFFTLTARLRRENALLICQVVWRT